MLPLVAVLAQGLHFVFALPVLLLGLVLGSLGTFGPSIPLGWPLVQAVPLFVLEGVFVAGIGLLLAALTVHFRDVKDLLATALSLWFFATPVLYTLAEIKQERVRALLRLQSGGAASSTPGATRSSTAAGSSRRAGASSSRSRVRRSSSATRFFDRLRDSYPEAV